MSINVAFSGSEILGQFGQIIFYTVKLLFMSRCMFLHLFIGLEKSYFLNISDYFFSKIKSHILKNLDPIPQDFKKEHDFFPYQKLFDFCQKSVSETDFSKYILL